MANGAAREPDERVLTKVVAIVATYDADDRVKELHDGRVVDLLDDEVAGSVADDNP